MKIKCTNCGTTKEVNRHLIAQILTPLGVGGIGFGFWAWVTYFFAGTGLALPICIAIVAGGTALLVFKEPIVKYLNKNYACPECGQKLWQHLS